jgi:hypothetical protein
MAAPNITPSTRYIHPGVTRVVYTVSVSNINAPSRAEINAGTDLSNEVAEADGWEVSSENVDAPDLGRTFTSKVIGRTSAGEPTLSMYASTTGADVRTLLPRGTAGFILLMWGGDVTGNKMDVYPIRVSANPKPLETGGDPARVGVSFAVTSQPAENVSVPA